MDSVVLNGTHYIRGTLPGMTDLNAYDIVMGFIFSSQIELNFTKLTVPTSETTNIKG